MSNLNDQQTKQSGLIAWFVHNSVAANLLMLVLLIGGVVSYLNMTKRMQPDIQMNMVQITVPYLGAAPQEVEDGVIIKVEEAIQDVKGIKRINSVAREGSGSVTATIYNDVDVDEALNEIKAQVDSIATLPGETEKPLVSKVEFSADVMWLSIYGNMDRRTRQTIAQEVRDEIMALPEVNKAELMGKRPYEISIEVSDSQMRKYDLTMSDVSQAIRQYSIDLPGGNIKTDGGDIRLRTKGQAYTGLEFANIVLRTNSDGTRLLLSDIANINDGFVESDGFARFNRQNATVIRVKSVGEQNDLEISKAVRNYVEQKRQTLPAGASLEIWGDGSIYLQERLDMMFGNMLMGVILVMLLLALFLRPKVALWVLVGIPICFCGALLFMDKIGPLSTNINFLSLFGLILVLGIVVDDAIIIGESVYTEIKEHGHSKENVIRGAHRVAVPATFGVLTTIAAFLPLLTLDFVFAPFFEAIAIVVILCLIFSLVESKWILPAHLAHMKYDAYDEKKASKFSKVQHAVRQSMENLANNVYKPILAAVVENRYKSLVIFFLIFILSIALLVKGLVRVEAFPKVAGDFVQINFSLNEGSPSSQRDALIARLENAVEATNETLIKRQGEGSQVLEHMLSWTNGDIGGGMFIELVKGEQRTVTAPDFEKVLREEVGVVAGVKELRIMSDMGAGGDASISFRLVGSNYHNLELASKDLQSRLGEYDGVFDIRTSYSSGSKEIELELLPGAETLGISLVDLGRQVRQAFYGEEAQRIQRGKDEVKVMVRYPLEERRSINNLENMRIRTSNGDWVPFSSIAKIKLGEGYSSIQREDRKRAISVMADFDPNKVESARVTEDIEKSFLSKIGQEYPGVKSERSGQSKEVEEMIGEIKVSMAVALALIFVLIAIPLKSYLQPFIVMSVIPFGLIGAVIGHLVFDKGFSMMSMFGVIALSGVVVNDSLIMVEFVNRARREGLSLMDAILSAGVKRFRAIMLTSLTTFFGLFPIMFETSMQAQIIIPMAISLAFGIMFATVITLLLIPVLYAIGADVKGLLKSLKNYFAKAMNLKPNVS
ncbi:MAG: efflux RND transporter permease subunit [Gammaproteobacteria bacterium]|nr:efflux RND transporter permease subunit [Gammaproteobacteria bacterium]